MATVSKAKLFLITDLTAKGFYAKIRGREKNIQRPDTNSTSQSLVVNIPLITGCDGVNLSDFS